MTERTTVRLPEELSHRAKRKAAAEGRTLTSLIEEGLRRVLAEKSETAEPARIMPRISKARGWLAARDSRPRKAKELRRPRIRSPPQKL